MTTKKELKKAIREVLKYIEPDRHIQAKIDGELQDIKGVSVVVHNNYTNIELRFYSEEVSMATEYEDDVEPPKKALPYVQEFNIKL